MIKAGCPEFVCRKCGKAREKIFETETKYRKRPNAHIKYEEGGPNGQPDQRIDGAQYTHIGYTDCGCNEGFEPGIVLDPFAGSGTTLQVAARLNRNYTGIELNPDYIEMAKKRVMQGETGISIQEQNQGQQAMNFCGADK